MAAELTAFLSRAAAERYEIGTWDCGFWLADWVQEVKGFDPVPEYRVWGSYDWDAANRRMPILVQFLARRAGLARTNDPKPGDIAIVRHGAFYGVIKSLRGCAALSAKGVASGPLPRGARLIRAWSVL